MLPCNQRDRILEMNGESYRLKRSRESAVTQPSEILPSDLAKTPCKKIP